MNFKKIIFFRNRINESRHLLAIWDKVFKSGLCKICGRQSLKNFEGILSAIIPSIF